MPFPQSIGGGYIGTRNQAQFALMNPATYAGQEVYVQEGEVYVVYYSNGTYWTAGGVVDAGLVPGTDRLKATVAKRTTLIPVSPLSSSLTVTRGAQNGGMVTPGGVQLLNGPWTGPDASLKAAAQAGKGIWMHAADTVNTLYGPPPWNFYATNSGRDVGSVPVSFIYDGQAFEVLMGNVAPRFSILVDEQWLWSGGAITNLITAGVAGATMSDGLQNTWVKIDFGSRAVRRIVLYNFSGGAIANIGRSSPTEVMLPWNRASAPVAVGFTDSYGQETPLFAVAGGLYAEALVELGIGTFIVDAVGGTGFARTSTQPLEANTIASRSRNMPVGLNPDLILFGAGLNDNASLPDAPLGLPTAEAAREAFIQGVRRSLANARAYAPKAVICMTGIWTPSQSNQNYATVGIRNHDKNVILRSLIAEDRGPWIWVDPEMGEFANSSGLVLGPYGTFNSSLVSSPNPTGVCWMTGTGRTGAPTGDGNADVYTNDAVHPNVPGTRAFGLMFVEALRTCIRAL